MSDYSVKDHIAYKMGFKAGQETQTARIAELEAMLERLMGPPPDKIKLRTGMMAAGVSEKTADQILSSPTFNRVVLEGGKKDDNDNH